MTFESFGLTRDPFADADLAAAGGRRLFAAAAAERAQEALQQAISEGPLLLGRGGPRTRIVFLVGAAGVGKTTLIATMQERLEQTGWLVATWNAEDAEQQPYVSALNLLETAFAATPVSVHLAAEHLAVAGISVVRPHVGSLERPTALIVDDADALIEPTIEDLIQVKAERALTGERCFCVVLVGTPSLVERCREMDAVAARTANGDEIRLVRLHGLSEEEVEPYLSHRLAAAGGVATSLFTPDAVTRIFAYSRGLPAVINRLGQAALALAEARGHGVVEAALLDEAALDCWLDEEKVAYSGIDDLSAEEQPGTLGAPETLAPPPTAGGADTLASGEAPVSACADQDRAPQLRPDNAADAVPEPSASTTAVPASAASAPATPEQSATGSMPPDNLGDAQVAVAAAGDAQEAQADMPAAGDAAAPPPDPAAPASQLAALAAFVRSRFGAGGRTIAAGAAVGALLVVGTATLVRQLAEPSPPPVVAEAGRDPRTAPVRPASAENAAKPESIAVQAAAPAPGPAPVSASAPIVASADPAQAEPAAAAPVHAPPKVQTSLPDAGDPALKAVKEAPALPTLAIGPMGDTGSLIERGTRLAALGDIASARRFFAAAARRGDGRASILLARTYDPMFFTGSVVSGTRPDPVQAVRWYADAERLGETGASQRLRALKADPASQKRN
ncbi:MAG: AAA family ATPase [Defluviicoccus sp.]|nr:AAA family ATPase [Defluviicoccus sp.]MDG4592075.1 AAA family ATPase [Defluviicoccus sp.]